MKRLFAFAAYCALVAGICFVCSSAFAVTYDDDCEFIRGDVDHDGDVDANDLTALVQRNISHDDAADCDDDGDVDTSDDAALAAWIVYGGTSNELPEPFGTGGTAGTVKGYDPTGDDWHNCCSKPASYGSVGYYSSYTADKIDEDDDWDVVDETEVEAYNTSCSDEHAWVNYEIEFEVTDSTDTSLLEMELGLVDISMEFSMDFEFFLNGYVCEGASCSSQSNNLLVDLSLAHVEIEVFVEDRQFNDVVDVGPGTPCDFDDGESGAANNEQLKVTYNRTKIFSVCDVDPALGADLTQTITLNLDNVEELISDDPYVGTADDCDQITIKKVRVVDIRLEYAPFTEGILDGPGIEMTSADVDIDHDPNYN